MAKWDGTANRRNVKEDNKPLPDVCFHSLTCSVCKLHLKCRFELRLDDLDRCNFFEYSMVTLHGIVTTQLTKHYGSCCSGNYGHYLACRFKDCPPDFRETCQRVEESLDTKCKGCPGINCANCEKAWHGDVIHPCYTSMLNTMIINTVMRIYHVHLRESYCEKWLNWKINLTHQ